MTVREALKNTLAALTYGGETAKGFDYGSTELALANMESEVFNNAVGIFIGDESVSPDWYSHAYYERIVTYEVLIAEKRSAYVPKFETYAGQFYTTLPGSSLGGAVGNVLNIAIEGEGEVEHPFATVWIKKMEVTISHLMEITLPVDFRINLTPPTITIDVFEQNVGGDDISITCTIVKGTGVLSKVYLVIVDSDGASLGKYVPAVNGENTVAFATSCLTGSSGTIYAVVTDEYGACGEATPLAITIA